MLRVCKVIPKAFSKPIKRSGLQKKYELGKEIQRILYPYNFFLTLFFSSKFYIRKNEIYAIGKSVIFLQFLSCCFVTAVTINVLTNTDIFFFIPSGNFLVVRFLSIFLPITRCSNFLMMFILNVVNRQNNLFLIVMVQNIHQNIKPVGIRRFIITNWVLVSIIMLTISSAFILVSGVIKFHYTLKIICEILMISFEVDFIYSIRILSLFNKYIEQWIHNVDSMSDDREDDEVHCKKLFATYQNILEAFDVYKGLYKVVVLFRTIIAFGRNLCFVEFVLQVVKIKDPNDGQLPLSSLIMGVMSLMGIIKELLQVSFHSLYCEKFYIALEDAEEACIRRMKNFNYTKSQEQLCMNVISENRKLSKMTACGLFYVDASLPLSLLEYFASYAIVLLQFAFL